MKELLIIVAVVCFIYPMRNLLGLLTRLAIYGAMIYVVFTDFPGLAKWDDKLFALALLSIPIVITLVFKFLKFKMQKA